MRRDFELIRELLRQIEEKSDLGHRKAEDFDIPGFERSQISYHIRLLYEAGFVSGEAIRSKSSPERLIDFWVFDLTWQGHEFLAAARNDTVWRKAFKKFGGQLSGVPFSVLSALLLHEAKKQLGLP